MICILCPRGCRLIVDPRPEAPSQLEDQNRNHNHNQNIQAIQVKGNQCPKGIDYARQEVLDPRRTLTTTLAIRGTRQRLPVRTQGEIPLNTLEQAMTILRTVQADPPIHMGQIIVEDLLGTGIPVVASDNWDYDEIMQGTKLP